jgi:flavin reductase (DIM6/NTAB) family NADH-FMN oxidoreductase RutF
MISKDWMLITAGNKDKFNMMTASWGGFGVLYNKPVAICFVNPARYTYQLMESGDTYTLTFYTEVYRDALKYCGSKSGRDEDKVAGSGLEPVQMESGAMAFRQAWMVIECKKLLSQSLSPDAIADPAERAKRAAQPMHKMYIGEILNVWVK